MMRLNVVVSYPMILVGGKRPFILGTFLINLHIVSSSDTEDPAEDFDEIGDEGWEFDVRFNSLDIYIYIMVALTCSIIIIIIDCQKWSTKYNQTNF